MKVIFVGMHNKPNTNPICPSTKTGKLVNRIIKELPEIQVLKTNLYDIEYYPKSEDKPPLARDWTFRIQPDLDDIIVLMGAEVHKNYIDTVGRVIKIAHPASKWSHVDMDEYVKLTSEKIIGLLTTNKDKSK